MGRVKEIIVKVIPAKEANEFIKKNHYSNKVVPNSFLHFGAFLDGKLHGVVSYGPPFVKRNVIGIVKDTKWNDMVELNRMAFDDYLPKYSESRVIAITIRLIKKNAPNIKWILSFADGTQCGDGTIYRASGFLLIGIKENDGLYEFDGEKLHGKILYDRCISKSFVIKDKEIKAIQEKTGKSLKRIEGKQLKYIYLIDKACSLNVDEIPFSKIDESGAGMYKGKKISLAERKALSLSDGVVTNPDSNLE